MTDGKISGVYQILNTRTNRMYIGASNDIFKRYKAHIRDLKHSKHESIKFQYAWDVSQNAEEFKLNILEEFDNELSDSLKWIPRNSYVTHYASDLFGYNVLSGDNYVYNKKYDKRFFDLYTKLNAEVYWNKHCIGELSGKPWRSKLANELIRKTIEAPHDLEDQICEHVFKYLCGLIDSLIWLNTKNEYNIINL